MNRLILELSLKPFHDISDQAIVQTIQTILIQWDRLIRNAENISFLLWTGDGSEQLDYRGRAEDEFEWAKWIGIANDPGVHSWDPARRTLHSKGQFYRPDPPRMTYERLAFIVATLKKQVAALTGRPATVGATFDPGPEFATSAFKYLRHPEISKGHIMGANRWISCAAVLKGDAVSYAGFPDGIAEGTSLGTFLGRQSQFFLADLGFDYLWLSNGFGYSLDSWNVTGEIFDGVKFSPEPGRSVHRKILQFWHDFRKECPHYPIETRGSNLSTGMDLSSDASPMRDIYRGGFNVVAPPNSPWAALNSDYGLELVGWLSHIAELPENNRIPFRYYIHDPWWLNSPWLDRYGREPHDIYLPLAIARIGPDGAIKPPDSVALLTIDNSFGEMPDEVPSEITPHLLRALKDFPDQPGLVTWIYPFDEYHDWTFGSPNRINEVFFGDWFMSAAVNQGFPLNTVVSTRNFVQAFEPGGGRFIDTILVSPAPELGSALAEKLCAHLSNGGRLLLYGPVTHLDPRLASLLDLRMAAPLSGEMELCHSFAGDSMESGIFPTRLLLRELVSGGGVDVDVPTGDDGSVLATVEAGGERRAFALVRELPGGGTIAWVRGALCSEVPTTGSGLPLRDNIEEWFGAERLMRWALQAFGISLRFRKPSLNTADPLILAARQNNGWFFSGFTPSTNVRLEWRFPLGVPIPVGCDVQLENGTGLMTLARSWHRECRVFIEQSIGEVSCREHYSGERAIARRLLVRGLRDATVNFLRDTSHSNCPTFTLNNAYPGLGTPVPAECSPTLLTGTGITGDLLISW